MYQLQHTVGRLYKDYLIYKGFGMTRKYKKALKDNLDQLYIQALGQVVLEGFPQYYCSNSIVSFNFTLFGLVYDLCSS